MLKKDAQNSEFRFSGNFIDNLRKVYGIGTRGVLPSDAAGSGYVAG